MAKTAVLPDRCLKCGGPAEGYRLRRNLSWHNPLYYLIALIALLLYVVVALIVRHTAKIEVPLCPRHRAKRLRAIAIGWGLSLAGIGAIVVGAMYSGPAAEPNLAILILVGIVMILVGLLWGAIGSQVAVPTKIDKYFVRLKKVSPTLLAELPDWPGWAS